MGAAASRGDLDRLLAESKWVRALARSLVAPGEAEDVVQQTWLAALQRPPRLGGDGDNLRGWLARVLSNVVRRRHRDEAVKRESLRRLSSECGQEARPAESRLVLQRDLAEAVLHLEEPYRSAIVLRYLDGLTPRELAVAQSVSYDAARKRLSRALAMLRSRLDRDYGNRNSWGVTCLALCSERGLAGALAGWGSLAMGSKTIWTFVAALALSVVAALWWTASEHEPRAPTTPDRDPIAAIEPPIEHEGGAPGTSERELVATEPGERGIDRERDLHGLVTDPLGAPVPGAVLEVLRGELSEFNSLDYGREREFVVVGTDTTSPRGEFAIALPPGREFCLAIEASGYARAEVEHCHAGERVDVRLEKAATLAGRVFEEADGTPIAQAQVEIGGGRFGGGLRTSRWSRTTTDSQGAFRLEGLTAGVRGLMVRTRGGGWWAREVTVEPGVENRIDVAIAPGERISGRVIDEDTLAPVADAEVGMFGFRQVVRTDAAGEFVCEGFSVQHMNLCVRAAGYSRAEIVLPPPGQRDGVRVEARLRRGRLARGRLVDAEGAPISGVYVAAVTSRSGQQAIRSDWVSAQSEDDGRFELRELRPDLAHVLWIKSDGLATVTYAFPPEEAELAQIDFGDIRIPVGGAIGGVLVDESDQPFVRFPLRLVGTNADLTAYTGVAAGRGEDRKRRDASPEQLRVIEDHLASRRTRTDDIGRFHFADLAPGTYSVQAALEGATDCEALEVQVVEGRSIGDLRFVLARRLSIAGQVLGDGGEPVDALVSCMTGRGGRQVSKLTDPQGCFRLEGLEATDYIVTVTPQGRDPGAPGPKWLQREFRGIAAGSVGTRLIMPRGAALTGVVPEAIGSGRRFRVHARAEVDDGEAFRKEVDLDVEGRFVLWVREDLSYTVHVRPLIELGNDETRVDSDDGHAGIVTDVRPSDSPLEIQLP
jgi:RNA polymerase sigma factor (sigma-70 family)